MADAVKIALKAGLIAIFMVAIWALFNGITFPSLVFTDDMIDGISFAKAVMNYWIPHSAEALVLAFGVAAFDIGILLFKLTMTATKWIMKVNE